MKKITYQKETNYIWGMLHEEPIKTRIISNNDIQAQNVKIQLINRIFENLKEIVLPVIENESFYKDNVMTHKYTLDLEKLEIKLRELK